MTNSIILPQTPDWADPSLTGVDEVEGAIVAVYCWSAPTVVGDKDLQCCSIDRYIDSHWSRQDVPAVQFGDDALTLEEAAARLGGIALEAARTAADVASLLDTLTCPRTTQQDRAGAVIPCADWCAESPCGGAQCWMDADQGSTAPSITTATTRAGDPSVYDARTAIEREIGYLADELVSVNMAIGVRGETTEPWLKYTLAGWRAFTVQVIRTLVTAEADAGRIRAALDARKR